MAASLEELYRFAEDHCIESVGWYLREKKGTSRWSVGDAQPTREQVDELLTRLKQFRSTVLGVIEEETREWIAEFESNLSRLESSLDSDRRATGGNDGRRH